MLSPFQHPLCRKRGAELGMFGSIKTLFKRADKAVPMRLTARLYEFHDSYFIAGVRWIAEVGTPSVLSVDVGSAELGRTILSHLAMYEPAEFDIRDKKKSDWPAFKASGAKSVKAFESHLWHCDLEQTGNCFEVWARPRLTLKQGLSAHCSVPCHDPINVGNAVKDALNAAKAMRSGEAI